MILEVTQLKKSFSQGGTELSILKGVDLSVAAGETVAIVGESGSGKSTLLSLLAGLDRPTSGAVTLDGTRLDTLDEKRLAEFRARRLGIIFQQFHLMSTLTALENVSLPLEIAGDPEARGKAELALGQVGLSHRHHHLPHQLSGGECQRVAIARAFVIRPKLILADEPSGNLDTKTGLEVMQLLFDQVEKNGMTLVLVTHNESLAARCKKQVRLAEGRVSG